MDPETLQPFKHETRNAEHETRNTEHGTLQTFQTSNFKPIKLSTNRHLPAHTDAESMFDIIR